MIRSVLPYIYRMLLLCAFSRVGVCVYSPVFPDIGLTEIQGMDVYANGSSLHAVLVGKQHNTHEMSVAYLQSRDYGSTWTKPVVVNRQQDGKVVSRRGNEAQVSAAGHRIVVAFNHAVDLPNAGQMSIAYSTNDGASWEQGENPAVGDLTQNQSYLDLVADEAGNFHLVWLDDREENGNTQGLRYARSSDGGHHWHGDVTLDPAACTCCWTRLAVLPDRSIAALYRDDDPHDMRLVRVSADGRSWRNLGAVGAFDWRFNGCPHCGGGIASASGKRGPVHSVAWSGKENAAGLYYLRSTDLGEQWSPPRRIGDGRSRESDVAVLSDGRVGVVFVGPSADGERLQFISSADQGKTWSHPKQISTPGAVADHPRIIATPSGFRVFWTEKQPAGGKVWAMYVITNPVGGRART
jgi:hypothetical protein